MELKKSKVFTHKLIALFLAAILAVSAFTGVMSVFAKSTDDYHDSNLAANFLTWAETTDNQTAEALLDYADLYLPQLMEGLDLGDIKPRGTTRINFKYDVPVIGSIEIKGYVDSIDGVIDLVKYVNANILHKKVLGNDLKNWAGGDIQNINLDSINSLSSSTTDGVVSRCGVAYRSQNDAKDIIIAVAKLLYVHANDYGSNKNVLNQFVTGNLNLGLIGNFLNLWDTLKDPLGMWDGYQTNLVYNIAANLIWENTDWYSEADIQRFKDDFIANGKDQTSWNYDDQLFKKLTEMLLQQINVEVTYSNKVKQIELDPNNANYGEFVVDKETGEPVYVKDSSHRRWFYIYKYIKQGQTYAEAVASVNANEGAQQGFWCDPNLRYSMNADGTSDGNVLLFEYGDQKLEVEKTDTLTEIAFNALELAWTSVLDATLGLLEVDFDRKVDSAIFANNYSNFDRDFYSWKSKAANGGWTKATVSDKDAWKANYSAESINAWAQDVYDNYEYKSGNGSAAEFLEGVREQYEFDRGIVENALNNWRDIDATKLFVELRYSPLADVGFNMQTGPINLYFAETGAMNIEEFFNTAFTEYTSIAQGFNNGIVAAAKDFLPDSANVGIKEDGEFVNVARPALATIKTADSQTIANTLVGSAAKLFEYIANTTDENILGAYYVNHPEADKTTSNNITEATFEEAGVPMMISLLNQISMTDQIHDEDWDTCIDAEGAAVVALREYLSYSLPDKDYSPLYTVNENNQLVADFDLNGDGKKELFTDCIMPMARDALGYVIQSVVTCRKANGSEWSVYTSEPTEDKTTIFEILNSVLCYYAGTDDFDNSSGSGPSTIMGKGAAALLGCVDSNGKCTVTMNKNIWQNLDTIINTVFPVVGLLQNNVYGGADSYDLIYNKFIDGVLEIGKQDAHGNRSITALIKQLVDIINSTPLNTGADVALYDYVVAPTVNSIFGPKYSGQTLNVIPANADFFRTDSSSNTDKESPFNALVHVDTLGGFNSMGILSTLISNLAEAFGVDSYKSVSGDRWQGAMFAVKAVNNFIPSFIPQLSDMKFGPVTAKMDIPSYSGLRGRQSINDSNNKLIITNTALGLNRFYRDGIQGKVQREKRYFAEIKSAELTNADGLTQVYLSGTTTGILAPGESLKVSVLGSAPRQSGIYVWKAEVTYNMYEAELVNGNKPQPTGNYLFDSDITTVTYLTLAVGGSWQSSIYPDGEAETDDEDNVTKYIITEDSTGVNTPGAVYGEDDATVVNSTAGGESNNLVASVPQNFVIPSGNPSIVDKYSIRVINVGNQNVKYNGAVAFAEEGTQYYAVNGTTVASTLSTVANNTTSDLAYAYCDSEGNLLNRDYYDYRVNGGEWQSGYSRAQLEAMEGEGGALYNDFKNGKVQERTHVTYTFDEALAAGIVTGVQKSGDDYTNVFVNPSSTLVSDSASGITFITPFDGFHFQNHGSTVSNLEASNDFLLKYDGSGEVAAKEPYKLNIAFIPATGNRMLVSTNVYVADQSDQYTLTEAFQEEVAKMASYRPADFLDFDGTESANYNAIVDAITQANVLAATALSVEAASKISSTKITQAKLGETMNHGGDKAYVPATADQIPDSVLGSAYKKGNFYYINKECTMPIYSNTVLKDSDVVDLVAGDPATGKDAAGQEVVKYGGVWYLANEYKYEGEWDTETYWYENPEDLDGAKLGAPYYATIKDADHIAMSGGNPVYLQKQFVYRDANGSKVNSDEDWVVKFGDGESVIKPNDENDYRGAYQQGIDMLNYYNSIFSKILKPVGAQSIAEEVTAVRSVDSNSVNYDVAAYEKMVMVAREAESLIWYEDEIDPVTGEYVYNEDGSRHQIPASDKASMEIEMAVNRFKTYYDRAQTTARGYIGDKLEAEIEAHHGAINDFTPSFDEEEGYSIAVANNASVGFGGVVDGYLANVDEEGNKKYTDSSWKAYVDALGAAVEAAQAKEAKVSEVYEFKKALVTAENNLDINTGEDNTKFTVSGKITIAEDSEGTSGTYGVAGIKILDAAGNEIGVSGENGIFEIQLTKGADNTLTIKGETTVDRTITITGEADLENLNIPIVVCDYLDDEDIDYKDVGLFVDYVDKPEVYTEYADLLQDGDVDYKDVGLFVDFVDVPVVYADWNQATYVIE